MNPFFVKTSGNINAPAVAMIHGWGMNSAVWETIRPALEAKYFMHWVDLPGYSVNHGVKANSMDEIVSLIHDQLPDDIHLIGWSLGGLVAQAIAERYQKESPDKIKSLSLITSSPKFSQSDDWIHAISHAVLTNFSKNLAEDVQGTLKRFIALQFMGIKDSKPIQKALINDVIKHSDSYLKKAKNRGGGDETKLFNDNTQSNNTTDNEDLNNPLHTLKLGLNILLEADYRNTTYTCPQQWVLADRDRLIPPAVINDLKLLRPNDQITLLENSGHAPFMTHPTEFLECVIPFIDSCS